jgi:alanine racemase
MHPPLRLTCDRSALVHNWRWLKERSGVACGAAVKADGYGLGAREAVAALGAAGCQTFFVSTWAEAAELHDLPPGAELLVLHGLRPEDISVALAGSVRPVLNSPEQVALWKDAAPGRPCDVMVDTGMNRLGLRPEQADLLRGLAIDTLHSHLACADEEHPMNGDQLRRFREVAAAVPAKRYSLANSAGICLGRDFSFDLVRPGLALYGGVPRKEAADAIRQVARVEAQVVQRREVRAGESCGYGATWTAVRDTPVAVVNIGYADGYLRAFSGVGLARAGDADLAVLGRVSMDLVALDCSAAPALRSGDWVELDYRLPEAAERSGLSQYELLTTLGRRFDRRWT